MTHARDLNALPAVLTEPLVADALAEDLGRGGDITTNAVIAERQRSTARLTARQDGIIAGLDLVETAFCLADAEISCRFKTSDGARVTPRTVLAEIAGPSRGILIAERTALNFLGHLSGVASETAKYVAAVEGTNAKIICTRKTTPGLRALQKYAVRAGGGMNHRFGLDDAILIKDNHIAAAGGVEPASEAARSAAGHLVKIEIEIDQPDQIATALNGGADVIMLDNMDLATMTAAVETINGRAVCEASGGVTLDTVRAIAETGVDYISVGAITHSAPALDVGLDFTTNYTIGHKE